MRPHALWLILFVMLWGTFPVWAVDSRPRTVLVLEGGGALGLAHVGVIQELERLGLRIDAVVGTSMGALVGGIYSLGYSGEELAQIAESTPWWRLMNEDRSVKEMSYEDRADLARVIAAVDFDSRGVQLSGGLLSGRKILTYLDFLGAEAGATDDFDRLPRTFRAVATDIVTGQPVVLAQGPFGDALRASMGVPGLFSPYEFDGHALVDGGLVSNLPIEVAKTLGADLVIAVHLANTKKPTQEELLRSPMVSLTRSLDILMAGNVLRQIPQADLLITIDITEFSTTDFGKSLAIIEKGRVGTQAQLAAIEAFVDDHHLRVSEALAPVAPRKLSRLSVNGLTASEAVLVRDEFAPFVGHPLDHRALLNAYFDLEDARNYRSFRFSVRPDGEGVKATIAAAKPAARSNTAALAVQSLVTYSDSNEQQTNIAPEVSYRGFTGEGSKVRISGQVVDTPGLTVSWFQPVATTDLGLRTGYQWFQDAATYTASSTYNLELRTNYQRFKSDLVWQPLPGLEVAGGVTSDWLGEYASAADLAGSKVSWVFRGTSEVHLNTLDSVSLPTSGVNLHASYAHSIPAWSDGSSFQVADVSLAWYFPLGPWSLGFLGGLKSDLTTSDGSTEQPPYVYRVSLDDRRLFTGPLYLEDSVGSHVLDAGIEIKYRTPDLSDFLGFPTFIVARFADGTVLQEPSGPTSWSKYHQATGSLGLGARWGFGSQLLVMAGVSESGDTFNGYFSIDFGAATY